MTDSTPAETATIKFHYTRKYCQKIIEEQNPCDWIEVTIVVSDTNIYGNYSQGITGLACSIVLQLLESIGVIFSENKYIIEFEYGPDWLVVEPWDKGSVNIARCTTMAGARNPERRLDIDTAVPVTNRGWIEAVTETAQGFRETVLDLNPDLHDNTAIEQIHYGTTWTETLLETEFDADQ